MSAFVKDVCMACRGVTYEGERATFDGSTYHRRCLCCSVCSRDLSSTVARADSRGALFCQAHAPVKAIAPQSPTTAAAAASSSLSLSSSLSSSATQLTSSQDAIQTNGGGSGEIPKGNPSTADGRSPNGGTANAAADSDEEDSVDSKAVEDAIAELARVNRRATRIGFLVKQGALVRNWKRRLFVMVGDTVSRELRYYKVGKGPLEAPRGVIDLATVRSFVALSFDVPSVPGFVRPVGGGGKCPGVAIDTPRRRWLLACESERDRDSWIQALNALCNPM